MSDFLVSPRETIDKTDPRKWEKLFAQAVALAGAGSCQFSAESKHLYLKDIIKLGEEHGFDILGMKNTDS